MAVFLAPVDPGSNTITDLLSFSCSVIKAGLASVVVWDDFRGLIFEPKVGDQLAQPRYSEEKQSQDHVVFRPCLLPPDHID